MYVRYVGGNVFDVPDVRDVRHFSIRSIAGHSNPDDERMELYDAGLVLPSALGDTAIKRMTTSQERETTLETFVDEFNGLHIFNNKEAAMRVLDEICKAIDAGKRYFDLTQYNDNGELITNPKPAP